MFVIWNPAAECMPRPRLKALQRERLRSSLALACDRVPLYRDKCATASVRLEDFYDLEDLAKFPFTTKQDLRDTYPFGMFARPLNEIARIHASSGTKGKPTVVGYTKDDLDVWAECVARSIGCAGGQPGDVLHNAYGYGLFTGGLGLHAGAERMGVTVVPASGGFTKRQVMLLMDLQAHGLSCTPSYALNIAETLAEMGIQPGALRLRYGIFGAEPWTEVMRQRIEEALDIDAVDIYGLSEVMGPGVATECREEKHGLHVVEDHFYVEVVDVDTGQPLPSGAYGELVFTSLTKQAFPVIRYRTGDLAAIIDAPCRCGRTHRRMTRIKGRVDDMLIVRGVNVFPQEVEAELLQLVELAPHYQIVLSRDGALDTMEVHVEWSTSTEVRQSDLNASSVGAGDRFAARIAATLRDRVQVTPHVIIHPPQTVPRSEGKAVRVVDKRPLNDGQP